VKCPMDSEHTMEKKNFDIVFYSEQVKNERMKALLIVLLVMSCAHERKQKVPEDVSLNSALNQAQASYLKGCVDAMKELGIPVAFPGCLDKSTLHRAEIRELFNDDEL
jgi:hypothetical protein